nr:glucose-6-phosphate isomerase [Paludibacteraceae bacterium]
MKLCLKNTAAFIDTAALKQLESKTEAANLLLENGQGAGNDYIGWVHLPSSITDQFLDEIQACADDLRKRCQVVIVAGIGGSYLGARAVNEALSSAFDAFVAHNRKNPYVVYAGNNIGEDYLAELMEFIADKQFGIINISKSG